MKRKIVSVVTLICVLISSVFFFGTCYLLWKNKGYAGSNHWFLFGTELDLVFKDYNLLALYGSGPLLIPLLIERKKLNFILAILAVLLFIFLRYTFYSFTD